jgi:hypothetical protein
VEDRGYETPCWIWQGVITPGGYGRIGTEPVHVRMYREHVGQVPVGMQIDHLCRVRNCCNPFHLEPVTRKVNVQRGLNATLTNEQVLDIWSRRGSDGATVISRMFGVSASAIRHIWKGRTWRNVTLGIESEEY